MERGTKLCMATTIPAKGSTGRCGVDKCVESLRENGDSETDVILKTDQEEAGRDRESQEESETGSRRLHAEQKVRTLWRLIEGHSWDQRDVVGRSV